MKLSDKRLFKEDAYINGIWSAADSGATFEVRNPATGEVIANVADMGGAETRRAIEVANAAWAGWREKLVDERSAILRRWHDLILENLDDLAILLTSEMGKPYKSERHEKKFVTGLPLLSGLPRKANVSMAIRGAFLLIKGICD